MATLYREDFTPYEAQVIGEIAQHLVHPSLVRRALNTAGWPLERLQRSALKGNAGLLPKVLAAITASVGKALVHTVKLGHQLSREATLRKAFAARGVMIASAEEIATRWEIDLAVMDRVADSFDMTGAALVGLEGVGMGLAINASELLPALVPAAIGADVYAATTLLSRHTGQVASSYGFTPSAPEGVRHVIAALAPMQLVDLNQTFPDEQIDTFAFVKSELGKEISKAARSLVGGLADQEMPLLVRVVMRTAQRLGLVLTEKELATLVPLAGALANGGLNVLFQQAGHSAAKDYFRRQVLIQRYGSDLVDGAIRAAVRQLQAEG